MKTLLIFLLLAFGLNAMPQVAPGSIVDETIDNYLATPAAGSVKTVPVVILRYLPTTDGLNLDVSKATDYWDLGNITLVQLKDNVDTYLAGLKFSLEEGSKFHGYKDPDAVPYLGYKVVKYWTIYDQIPISTTYQLGEVEGFGVFEPDFFQVYNDFGLQQFIENNDVKEIWIWFGQCAMPGWPSYNPAIHFPENFVEFVESNMASPVTGDISNSNRFPDDVPISDKTVVVYCYNFRRTQAEAVHNHGHQLESIYKYTAFQQDGNENLFVHDFSGWGVDYSSPPLGRAGDCHHPPNTTEDYDYLNPTLVESDIEDWKPAVGPKKWVNVDTWANLDYSWPAGYTFPQLTESQWYIYWLQNMPGYGSSIPYNSNYMTNWWLLTSDWDSCNIHNVGLYAAAQGQVSINSDGSAPDNSAMLDVKATDRGLLIPRISTAARNLIPSPATGLIIFNTTTNQFNYYNGTYWYQSEATIISSTIGTLAVGGGVSINTSPNSPPVNSAMLDVNSPTRGILIPRTTPEMITSPATGLIIYNTASNQLNYYNGTQWNILCSVSSGIAGAAGSQTSVGVAIKTNNLNPHHSAMLDVSAPDKGVLIPRLTNEQRDAILPVAGLVIYNTTVNNIEFYNGTVWYRFSTNLIDAPTSGSHVPAATQIIWNWNAVTGASGYKWNTSNDYATATDLGNITTKTETALVCNTGYTRYAWAYNSCGNSSALSMAQTTSACFTCGSSITINHVAGSVAPVAKTVTYGTVTNIPGEPSKCWISSNLGADHQATAKNDATEASAGWYFQFNRKQGYKHDGSIRTPATTWISSISETSSWVAVNDPCTIELGSGWRVPTGSEWGNVDATGNWTSGNGPWNSALKLHYAGSLHYIDGSLQSRGTGGSQWSTDMDSSTNAWLLGFSTGCNINSYNKAFAVSVRCIKN